MALFKFRKGRDEQPASVAPAQTVEAVRRRAMHRLIGAALLVLAGVIGFPMIFDNQPRPIPVDLPIVIVDKNKAKPLVMPPAAANTAAVGAAVSASAASIVTTESAEPAAASKPVDAEAKPVSIAEPAPAVAAVRAEKAASSAAEVAEAKALDAKKARALLEGRPVAGSSKTAVDTAASAPTPAGAKPAAAASDERYVVQVGAFADAAKVREVRRKVESAGLKTYTQVVRTAEGERTRVRVGPFDDKAEATKAADKIRKLSLSVAILTL